MDKIINCLEIRDKIKSELKIKINEIPTKLKLVVVQVGDDPASNVYIKNKQKLCEELGILFEHQKYLTITQDKLLKEIDKLNKDQTVTGILVQLPLPKEIDEKKIIEKISPLKDVDGLTSQNMGKLFTGNKALVPCTALGIIKMLEAYNIKTEGAHAVIIGRSNIVGKPLIQCLLNKNATVTVCHSKTKNIEEITKQADILIAALGKPKFVTEKMVKEGATVIDVGINRLEDGKIVGDTDFENIKDKVSYITPVPGGVGPMTIAMLMNNVIKAASANNK